MKPSVHGKGFARYALTVHLVVTVVVVVAHRDAGSVVAVESATGTIIAALAAVR